MTIGGKLEIDLADITNVFADGFCKLEIYLAILHYYLPP